MSNPVQLLKLARELMDEQGAPRRASISRAYYAGFHALGEVLVPMLRPSDLGKHGGARHRAVARALLEWERLHPVRKLANGYGREARLMSQLFTHCLHKREQADYQMGERGEVSLDEALSVIGKVERMLKFAAKAR